MERSPADARVAPTTARSANNNVKVPTSPAGDRTDEPGEPKSHAKRPSGPREPQTCTEHSLS
eukprot:scaffold19438_cov154-Isochrysis_galbana.AAC.3